MAARALDVEARREAAGGESELGQQSERDAREHGGGERCGVPPRAQPKEADDQRRRRRRHHRDVAQTAEQIHPRSVGWRDWPKSEAGLTNSALADGAFLSERAASPQSPRDVRRKIQLVIGLVARYREVVVAAAAPRDAEGDQAKVLHVISSGRARAAADSISVHDGADACRSAPGRGGGHAADRRGLHNRAV